MALAAVVRALVALVACVSGVGSVGASMGTTTDDAAGYSYDVLALARVDVHELVNAEANLRASSEASASRSVDARSTSTTPISRSVATNRVDDLAGAACRANSFVPSTLVLMADGTAKPIEDVQVGDLVMATDPEAGEKGPRRVADLIVGDGLKELVDVEIEGEVITATGGHPFWVDDQGRWVDADDLDVGDLLLTSDGITVAVEGVRTRREVRRVHNLTVEGIHTYHVVVNDSSVLVHNCNITPKIPRQMGTRGWTDESFKRSERVPTSRAASGIWLPMRQLPPTHAGTTSTSSSTI